MNGGQLAHRFDRKLIGPMILGSILNPINSSIIAVSLVPIGRAFGAPAAQTAWLISALYLATAIGQPVVGRLVDLFGPKRLFLAGAVLTGVAGLLGALAPNLAVLVVARVILGLGTCAGYPASMFLIRAESRRTGLASPSGVLTALAVASQTVAAVGPTLGGLLIDLGGWRTTFAINVPLAVVSFATAAVFLPGGDAACGAAPHSGHPRTRMDLPGIALFAAMLVSLLLFLMNPGLRHAYLPAVTAVAGVALARRELRTTEPFLDLRLLGGNLPLLATYARTLLAMTVSYAFLYGFTQWAEDSRNLSPTGAGLLLLPMSAVGIAVAAITGRRPQIRGKLIAGAVAQLAGCALLLVLGARCGIWLLVVLAVVFGIPQGLNSLANQNAVYHQAHPERLGSSSGLLRTFTYLGAITASAATAAFFGRTADTPGLHHLGVFLVAAAALFLILTITDRSLARVGRPDGDGGPAPTTRLAATGAR
ncbi:MFS transporter [Rhizomonospora bruguierae]|uniref:MFS transporter n=1 Tax=Rhizomonospora bruguierae TaxID=1581705 RepID=UPI0020BD6F0B|nr:MFS transporter [Micromonospora sp. NBRC 107566]